MRTLKSSQLTSPVEYEIHIKGYLDKNWSDRLSGMTIVSLEDETGGIITSLHGALSDQAALFGVLNALYDMRLPLLYVTCKKPEKIKESL